MESTKKLSFVRKIPENSIRFQKILESSKNYKKESSKRFEKALEGSKMFEKRHH
jgi:hypothetical protein